MTRTIRAVAVVAAMLLASIAQAQFQGSSATATWTTATAQNTRLSISTLYYTSVAVTYVGTTTLTAGALAFEVSDDNGVTWYPTSLTRTDAFASESTYTLVVGSQAWQRNIVAFTNFGVRLSTAITGTGSVTIRMQPSVGSTNHAMTVGQGTFSLNNVRASLDNANRFVCTLTTAATTSTAITGCAAPGAGLARYITDVSVYGGVAVGITAAATIQSGTGGTCGTGTVIDYYCQHAATAGCEHTFATAVRAVTNGEICILDAAVGTKFVVVSGFTAP